MRGPRVPGWLYVLFLALLTTATDEFVIAGVLPRIATDLRLSPSVVGQLVTVFALAYAVGAPTLAVVVARWPRRTVLVCGLAVFVLANVASAIAPSFGVLLAARVGAALAAAVITSAAFGTAAAGAPPGQQGRYLAVTTAGMTVALFTGVPVGTVLGDLVGWRATFWLIAAVGTVTAIGLLMTVPTLPGEAPPATLGQRLAPLRSRAALRLVAVTFLAAGGGLMFYTYLGVYVARTGAGRPLSVVLLVAGVAGLTGALLSGRAVDRLGARFSLRLVLGGHALALLVIAGAGFLGVGGPPGLVMLLVLVALWSMFAWGLTPPVQGSMFVAVGPAAAMPALALNVAGLYLGTSVAGALGGLVLAAADARLIPLLGALFLVCSYLLAAGPPGGRDRGPRPGHQHPDTVVANAGTTRR
ncbi:MFS transporter [Plantactinospora sp. GCM10030261]|uniref:MFS transporter n=1 Tax=Plantactinospora sp. GCM10030261 TaxID=3273420 RepID=UPI0036169863